ncbi:MAG: hypothetical protein M1825_006308 [Sarcosagium campestre]|nr:MAG: hypothetical protein M1825_006308 [Sarcosagium campestre]
MTEPTSDADRIRNKRLAKLQGQSSPAPQGEKQAEGSNESLQDLGTGGVGDPKQGARLQDVGQSEPGTYSAGAAAASGSKSAQGPSLSRQNVDTAKRIRITPAGATSSAQNVQDGDSSSLIAETNPASTRPASGKGVASDSMEVWEDRVLSNIFQVSLQPDTSRTAPAASTYELPGLRSELEDQGEPLRMTLTNLDQAILEAATAAKETSTPLDYLLGCWKRVVQHSRGLKSGSDADQKYQIIKEARRLCMSYCVFAITMPDMFDWEPVESNLLAAHLLIHPDDERGLCQDFLAEAVSRFSEFESLKDMLVEAILDLSRRLWPLSMNDDFKPYVNASSGALKGIARFPPLVDAVAQSAQFLRPGLEAQNIEEHTFFGPFFQLSPLQGPVTQNYFAGAQSKDQGYVINAQKSLRMTLQMHQTDLLEVVNHFIRASKESRNRILDWFALTVNANHKRRAIQVDNKAVSTDGLMINVTVCLDQLCEPFMDSAFSKVDRIDVEYFRRKPRVNIRDETKLNADQQAYDDYYAHEVEGTSNFISEVFFLTLAAHHYGMDAAINKLDSLEKDIKHLQKQLQRLEDELATLQNPRHRTMLEDTIKKYRVVVERSISYRYSVQGVLYDDLCQARSMQFMRYVIVWLLKLVTPQGGYPKQQVKYVDSLQAIVVLYELKLRQTSSRLPLSDEQPDVFKTLPEYFLEDVINTFKFIFRHMSHVITSTQSDELVTICVTFLRSSEYIKNPHFKSELVAILFYGIFPTYTRQKGVLGDLLNGLPFANEHLLHALMKAYIEVEITGAHNQFYDKFNVRYEIFQVIKCIWSNPIYRDRLAQESKVNVDFFVRFVNLLLNDVTFVLDESLSAFEKINNVSKELKNPLLAENIRTEKEDHLAELEGKAKNFMQLTNETMSMLKLFTEALATSFTMPEIVQRLADMLDYNLDAMVGPKSSNLNVEKKQEYGFQPKVLLSEIVDVYLNLMNKPTFVEAVAKDGRSYKPDNFDKATSILQRFSLKSPEEMTRWKKVGERIKKAKELDDQAEEDLGEVPEDYLDPLLFSIMKEPVILPTSRTTIDLSTIRSHLLSDPNDPFNRAPLKIEEVIPNTELKAKIEAFIAEKKGRRKSVSDEMDFTSG